MKKLTDEELETECDVVVKVPPKKRYKVRAVVKSIKKGELRIMEKLTDKELKKSLDAIEKVKRSCPELPRDMSINHDKYLAEMSRIVNSDYIKEIEELKKRVKELEQELEKYKAFWEDARIADKLQWEINKNNQRR